MILSEEQIYQISTLLRGRNNITNSSVLEEMTDHMCCLVEKKMILGQCFEEAFRDATEEISPEDTRQIEESVKRIDFRRKIRRKVKSISAVAATFILMLVAVANAQNQPEGPPVKGNVKITSRFGKKRTAENQKPKYHRGVDYKLKIGTPIYATADGIVSETQHSATGYGIKIVIDHEESFQTLFGHLSKISVKEGQKVKKGELIGYSGNSGQSSGPHLHYEVRKAGKTVNPHPFIDADK